MVGTGTNAAYVEPLANVETYRFPDDVDPTTAAESTGVVVINTEWGNFGSPVVTEDGVDKEVEGEAFRALDAVRNEFDRTIDENSLNPGARALIAIACLLDPDPPDPIAQSFGKSTCTLPELTLHLSTA